MTPAIDYLDKHDIKYRVLKYQPNLDGPAGMDAASKLGLNPDQVLKTLIVALEGKSGERRLAVAIIPAANGLRLSALAKAAGVRRAMMAEPAKAERATGYVVGGISPFGQRRALPTYLDCLAITFDRIFVNGGRRGMMLEVDPSDLREACSASVSDITSTTSPPIRGSR
jgi:Cys-tRNA(Pro)/Cys-tRNA(Cys) deacylase